MLSSVLSYTHLATGSPFWATSSLPETGVAIPVAWVLLGIAAGVVLTCLILAGLILAVRDKATDEPKEQQAEPARARGRRANRKSAASAGTSSPVQKRPRQVTTREKVTLPLPATATTRGFAEPEELTSESGVETPALPEPALEKTDSERAGPLQAPVPAEVLVPDRVVWPEPRREEPTAREAPLPPPVTGEPLAITELKIDPPQARPGEAVAVSVRATNMNDVPTYYSITLRVNGEVVTTRGLSLRRRASLPTSFTVSRSTPGYYRVEVNDAAGEFTVVQSST